MVRVFSHFLSDVEKSRDLIRGLLTIDRLEGSDSPILATSPVTPTSSNGAMTPYTDGSSPKPDWQFWENSGRGMSDTTGRTSPQSMRTRFDIWSPPTNSEEYASSAVRSSENANFLFLPIQMGCLAALFKFEY